MESITEKRCSACGEVKPLHEFKKRKSSPDGHRGKCKSCRAPGEKAKKQRYLSNPVNREKAREYSRSYVASHKDERREYAVKNAQKIKARMAQYRRRNKEKIAAYNKQYYRERPERKIIGRFFTKRYRENNPEKVLKYQKEYRNNPTTKIKAKITKHKWRTRNIGSVKAYEKRYRQENPEKFLNNNRKRRARLNNSGGSFTDAEWRSLCEKFDNKCLSCGKRKQLCADHIVPLIKGGTNTIDNIQPLCRSCNSKKYISIIDYRPNM